MYFEETKGHPFNLPHMIKFILASSTSLLIKNCNYVVTPYKIFLVSKVAISDHCINVCKGLW